MGKAGFKLATTFEARELRLVAMLNVKQYQMENKIIAKATPIYSHVKNGSLCPSYSLLSKLFE